MNQETITEQVTDAAVEPTPTSQRDEETVSERSGSVAVSDVVIDVTSNQDQGSEAGAAQGSESSAP